MLRVCARLGMSAQNYYARRRRGQRREVDTALVLELVRAHRQQQPRLGGRKLYHLIGPELRAAGVKLGRDRFFAELGQAGLLVEKKRSCWPKTTHRDRNLPVFRNLIRRRKLSGPHQVWVADITYIRTRERFLYLSLITDLWSRKIIGRHLGQTLESHNAQKALAMALRGLPQGCRPIHHSDRGCQYAAHGYVAVARRAGLRLSMTETNHSAENAVAERVNGILKDEYWLDSEFEHAPEARQATDRAIELYNTRRPHSSLDMLTPAQRHAGDQTVAISPRGVKASVASRNGARGNSNQPRQWKMHRRKYQIYFRT